MFQNQDPSHSSYGEQPQEQIHARTTAVLERPASATAAGQQQYTSQTPVYTPQAPTYQQGAVQAPGYPYTVPQPPMPPRKKSRRLRTGMIFVLTLVLLIVFGIGLFAGWVFANDGGGTGTIAAATSGSATNATTLQTQQEAAIAKIEPSVVQLDVTTAQGGQLGSGVIINSNGDIITNNHVVSGGQSIQAVLNDGKTETAQVVGTDPGNDLAVVHIQPFAHMAVATIGDSSKLTVGQEVLAVGNPLGITETATNGIISALNRSVTEPTHVTIKNAIQTDAPINPGNSGGALVNLQGELIGIPTLTAVDSELNTPASGVGFAIPSNQVKTAVAQILQQAG
ncbi:MAG TPA: trypsin-like peptidase domain-containing protein [Ktedonobacteraceae bacterium]|jgi:S1-C subfamily serine protease|nr:trypsin-like peptidase domain-containing protein [Ktedonobacteraceae bacterium]